MLTDEAEKAVEEYEKQVARARVVSPDEYDDVVLSLAEPGGESEEDPWAGAGFDDGEPEAHEASDRGGLHEQAQQLAPRVVKPKHSVNVEAQVKALQEEAAAENDNIDRAMRALGMRQHEGKMENVFCVVGKGARTVAACLTQKGALTGLHAGSKSVPGHEADTYGHVQLRASGEIAGDASWMAPVWKILAVEVSLSEASISFQRGCAGCRFVWSRDGDRRQGAAHAGGSRPH